MGFSLGCYCLGNFCDGMGSRFERDGRRYDSSSPPAVGVGWWLGESDTIYESVVCLVLCVIVLGGRGVCETLFSLVFCVHITEEGFLGCGDGDGFNGWKN